METPLISIIIAVYNNKKYIRNAVNSVLCQQRNDVEIVIIDDGSTDGTREIVDDIALKNNNVRTFHQKNQWIYASFNRGIKEAKGEYIYILNSDDLLAEGSLEALVNAIGKYNRPDVIWTKVFVCKCDYEQRIESKKDARPTIQTDYYWSSGSDDKSAWVELITSDLMIDQANLYRRELIKDFAFRNDVYGADHLFNISIAPSIQSFAIIPDEIYLFIQYDNPQMNASVGKYYGYEHEMFNEFLIEGKKLANKLEISDERIEGFLEQRRKENFSAEIKALLRYGQQELDEKIDIIMKKEIDSLILQVFKDREELDARILSALRETFVKIIPEVNAKYRFIYDLLVALMRYEKDDEDIQIIKSAVYNADNPLRLGECFYKKLMRGNENG